MLLTYAIMSVFFGFIRGELRIIAAGRLRML